jgi:carbonic anhydrase
MVQDAWQRGQELVVHGWFYGLRNGLLEDLKLTVASSDALAAAYDKALAGVHSRYSNAGEP